MSEPVNNDESPAPVSEPVDPAPTTPAVAPEAVNNSTEENIGDDQPKSDNPTPPPPLSAGSSSGPKKQIALSEKTPEVIGTSPLPAPAAAAAAQQMAPPSASLQGGGLGSSAVSSASKEKLNDKSVKKKNVDMDEHMLNLQQISERYNCSVNDKKPMESGGLPLNIAQQRLVEYGPNVLTPPKRVHPLIAYLKCVAATFNALLVICGVLEWVLLYYPGNFPVNTYLGAILVAVALINGFIEFYQHQKSAKLLESFLNMIPANCNIIRDNHMTVGPAANLVPGDLIFVKMGDKVPADFWVIKASDFKVDNSSLTGESEPQERTNHNSHENPLEATNLAFNGTLAVSGEAFGIVVRTGDQTVLGQIANLTQGEAKRASPLSQEIDRFVNIISVFAISSAVIFFIVSIVKSIQGGQNANAAVSGGLNFAIGVLVAWVPQGLPATVSMLLTFAAQRMAKRQVLVKDLQGVETLGAITLLATDKTGTLTRNQMTVTNMWTSMKMLLADSNESAVGDGEVAFDRSISGVDEIIHISCMCSRARFDRVDKPVKERQINGDATESGLFRFASVKLDLEVDKLADKYPKVFEIPFNSDTKWHMSIHKKKHENGFLTQYIKGAPERILRICSHILIDGKAIPMSEVHQATFNRAYETMAGKGHRVLAFAQNLLEGSTFPEDYVFDKETKNFPTTELCFVGLTSLEDPPKHGVREAIGHCREAGIKVMMVTGDHPLTAEAIGRKINLMLSDTKQKLAARTNRPVESIKEDEYFAIVIHGEKIDSLTEEDWDNIFSKDEIIFARTSPKHKLQIVKRAQAHGHIVGVTGDGVNDSPALKKADLGIAMNISGSDVSKEAAAMILLDDNFASTVNGISEGRLIFVNLKKSIQYVVTHIMPEVIPFLLSVAVPIPVGLGALQILVIDLGFELFAALSFAFEPPETPTGLMKVPPRKPVTPETIRKLKMKTERRKERALASGVDSESGDLLKAPLSTRLAHNIKHFFSKDYWKEVFEAPDGEILVDSGVLSWAYLEFGIIEFVGCMTAFFVSLWFGSSPGPDNISNQVGSISNQQFKISPWDSVQMASSGSMFNWNNASAAPNYTTLAGTTLNGADQNEALAQAQSIYYLSVMIIQMFNLFACKCRIVTPLLSLYPLKNRYTWVSVFGGAAVAFFIVYCPGLSYGFQASRFTKPLLWLIPIATGFVLILYAAVRRATLNYFKPTKMNLEIAGLQMYPTRWSTGGK